MEKKNPILIVVVSRTPYRKTVPWSACTKKKSIKTKSIIVTPKFWTGRLFHCFLGGGRILLEQVYNFSF